MSSDMVAMSHKDSDQPVLVLPSQVDNMKQYGWFEATEKPSKKQRVAKPKSPVNDDTDEVNRDG